MKYFTHIVLVFVGIVGILGAQNSDIKVSTQEMYKVLDAAKQAKSGLKEKPYQDVVLWERKLSKDFAYVKKLQGKNITSDQEAYQKTLIQAYGSKEVTLWQSQGLEMNANSPLGIASVLLAVKLLYPTNPRQSINQLNSIYKHQVIASNLIDDQEKVLSSISLLASNLP